ncbi:YciI family protein [Isoalcanivorax indicus]|uniref:YciI family protein n=1 Tax=Isoalcanivorax indicus TaxID=2202653 RepID=UPI000DBA72FD|nr:YciI family protein [Isoalcanivorax indicus]
MQYLCLIYGALRQPCVLPACGAEAVAVAHLVCDDVVRASRHYLAAEALDDAASTASVRVQQGRYHVIPGPLLSGGAILSGFLLIEARDLNDAIRVASRVPFAEGGTVEVRPVRPVPRSEREYLD